MKKVPLLLFALAAVASIHAQPTTKALKAIVTLKMPRTADDDKPGTRGASVAWHPVQKKYYASMAGNVEYPMGVFDATGNLLSGNDLSTGQDTRGLWFNTLKKQVQGNAYADGGWFGYILNAKGIPLSSKVFLEDSHQPDEQAVGAYNGAKQTVLFLSGSKVYSYSMTGEQVGDPLSIQFGRKKTDPVVEGELEDDMEDDLTPEDYNYTSVVYTGIKGQELGFLNTTNMEIELYDMVSGFMTKRLALPIDAPVNASFNFAYANGMYWLFSMEERKWTGYK